MSDHRRDHADRHAAGGPDELDLSGYALGATELDDLNDVNAPSPSNNDILTWDSTPGEWVAAPAAAGYTDEEARDAVGAILSDTTTVDLTYTDAGAGAGTITAIVIDASITNAKLANMVQGLIKGRAAGAGTGEPVDLTQAQVFAILGSGSPSSSTFLRGDGSWTTVAAAGVAADSLYRYWALR